MSSLPVISAGVHDSSAHYRRSTLACRLVLMLCTTAATAILLAAATSAEAQEPLPPAVTEQIDGVHGFAEKGGLPNGRPPVSCDDECTTLWESELALVLGQPTSNEIRGQLAELRRRVRLLPSLTSILGRVTLAGTAFYGGWEIGSALRSIWVTDNHPPAPGPRPYGFMSVPITGERFVHKGDEIPSPSLNETVVAPHDGYVGTAQLSGNDKAIQTCCLEHGNTPTAADQAQPGYETQLEWDWVPSSQLPYYGWWYFRAGAPRVDETQGSAQRNGPRIDWPSDTEGTNGESATATLDRLVAELNNNPGDYGTLLDWLCAQLGGDCEDPTGQLIRMPSCRGESYTTCRTRLQTAGLTGTITAHTLSSDDAVVEEQADRTTATSPAVRSQTLYGADITVYVNPETMPTMTATENLIAAALKTNNPDTITDDNKKTIARTCVRYATSGGRTASDCASLPIFLTGNDAAQPAVNDRAALTRNPSWALLNRRNTTSVTTDRHWYRDRSEPAPGCVQGVNQPDGYDHCHEFPFFPTLQAYEGSLNNGAFATTPSIRWTPPRQNRWQGRVLQQFFTNNNPGPRLAFHGCNITAESPTTIAPLPTSAFLNLPLGAITEIPTVGICNKPAP